MGHVIKSPSFHVKRGWFTFAVNQPLNLWISLQNWCKRVQKQIHLSLLRRSPVYLNQRQGSRIEERLNRKSADCPQNIAIFGLLTRKDIDTEEIFFDAVLQDTNFYKRGVVVITGITHESVKVQFLEKRSYQNFYQEFDETYNDELDLGEWPHIFPDNISSGGMKGRSSQIEKSAGTKT